MHKIKINSSWIIAFVLLMFFTFIYLVINFYQTALLKSKLTHQQQQLEMVKSAASGMSYYLAHLQEDLEIWPSLAPADLQQRLFYPDMPEGVVRSIFLLNSQYKIIYQQGKTLPRWIDDELKLADRSLWIAGDKTDDTRPCWYSPVRPADTTVTESSYVFIMLSPCRVNPAHTLLILIG
jgi:hypothetical protein